MNNETKDYINLTLDVLADTVADLEKLSIENDDIFSNETLEMAELIKRARRLLAQTPTKETDMNDVWGINYGHEMKGGNL